MGSIINANLCHRRLDRLQPGAHLRPGGDHDDERDHDDLRSHVLVVLRQPQLFTVDL